MVMNFGRVEDVFYTGKSLQTMASCLVVHYTDTPVGKLVETVDATTDS